MTATMQDIMGFLLRAKDKGARWLLVGCDSFDHGDYPIFVMPGEDPHKAFPTNGDRVHEVYDLALDSASQLRERRAWHLPKEEPA